MTARHAYIDYERLTHKFKPFRWSENRGEPDGLLKPQATGSDGPGNGLSRGWDENCAVLLPKTRLLGVSS
jgi:hypothetical protein